MTCTICILAPIALVEKMRWEITDSKESVVVQLEELHEFAQMLERELGSSQEFLNIIKMQSNENQNVLDELNRNADDLKRNADDMKAKIESVHRDSVTILGIFASIVMAFTAGMFFSGSVLENFHKGTPYRIFAIVILIGIVLINTIGVLMIYIEKIRKVSEPKMKYPVFLIILDIIGVLGLIAIFVTWIILGS